MHIRRIGSSAALCLLAVGVVPALAAQVTPARNRIALEQYLDFEDVQNPMLSPDGTQIIFTRRWVDKMNDRYATDVWLMNTDGSHPRALVQGSDVRWSPDGKRIAYIAKGEPAGAQIWVRWMDAEGATSQISHLTEAPSNLEWSPDGTTIAFTMNVADNSGQWRIPMPAPPKGAKWVEAPKIVTRLDYRSDHVGFDDEAYAHVFVIPASGGTPRQITSGDWNHGAPSFSADGKWLAFSANRVPDSQHEFRQSEVYSASVETGEIRQLTHHSGTDANPLYSPDGKYIAYLSADSTYHAQVDDPKLTLMNTDGSGRRVLTGSVDRTISDISWAPNSSGLYFGVSGEGSKNLYFAPVIGAVRQVSVGTHMLTVTDVSANGLAVGLRTTPLKPNDVVTFTVPATGTVSTFKQVTAVNDDLLEGKALAQTEEVWYKSKDGLRIQGWIVKPPDFDPRKKYPLILDIHGGPHGMYNVAFSYARQNHAAQGFVVLYTNPRGSTGYGLKFTNEITNTYPDKDFDDLMAGVDTVIGRGYIDTKNLFVYGCSGGGVLTAWVVGHTDRFAAAAVQCPVINWLSFVGQTDGSGWYENFDKPFWEDPSEHLKRSPIMYVGHVKTPTILMTGVLDLRTPMPQSEEFYEALRLRKVPTALIRFNNEWHGVDRNTPSNFLRAQLYLHSWFDKYSTKPTGRATTSEQIP